MNCKKCNAQLNDENIFCPVCGERVKEIKAENIESIKDKEDFKVDLKISDANPYIKMKKKIFLFSSILILFIVSSIIIYNIVTISNKDIDKALASMDNRKITKILNKIDDKQIPYFEEATKNSLKNYLINLGYDYSSENFIIDINENFINDLSTKLSFLDNNRLNKSGLIYDIKYYADMIVGNDKISTEVDMDKVNKFFELEEKSGYVIERIKSSEDEKKYTNLYYVSTDFFNEDMDYLIEENEEGVIPKGEIIGKFIYLRDEQIMSDGFTKIMPVYEYYSEEEVINIETEYYKIDMNTPKYIEELQNIIIDFLNKN